MAKSALAPQTDAATSLLLVEDDPSDAYIIGELLSVSDITSYDVTHVKTQSHAILALDKQAFDVCLLDLTLPDACGFSALIDIQEKAPDMPVLILTGVDDTSLAKRAVGRGAQYYLLKDELAQALLERSIDCARERKRIEKELFIRANFDPLTGLANRSLFESRLKMALARAERMGAGLAVLFLDLDRFKPVNDTYGHEAGDDVLKTVATRISGILRAYDTAARIGGDEFAVLLENIASERNAAMIANKIIGTLSTGIPHRAQTLYVGASVGVAYSETESKAEVMLQNADAAMYQAKQDGGNNYHFYAPELHLKAQSRLKLEDELRMALPDGQLRLYYQPYVTPENGAVLGVETLLRWMHPRRGMLYANEFLNLAEECRLMPDIGSWMFAKLRRDIDVWNMHKVPPLDIAFNISASQMADGGFLDAIAPLTDRAGISPHRCVAEIDSQALETLSQKLFLTLVGLRERGITLHIDHFGQGPMSLQMLHSYPFSLLKLDLSALSPHNTDQENAIVRTAIDLAHQMGMKAGAVGVETAQQLQSLKAQRCDMLQGFLISHPMTAEQLPGWLMKKH